MHTIDMENVTAAGEPVYVQLVIEYQDTEWPTVPHHVVYQLMDYSPGFPYSKRLMNTFSQLKPTFHTRILPMPTSFPRPTHEIPYQISQ